MNKIFFALLILLNINSKTYCQISYPADSAAVVGLFQKYVQKNIHYPAMARENRFSGQVIVAFWVNEDKSISDIKILKGLDDNNSCENEAIRCIKSFQGGLNTKADEYVCSVVFVMTNDDGEEIHDFSKVKNIALNYRNFLFENKIIGYGYIRKRILTDGGGETYIIPSFTEHTNKVKLLTVTAFKANNHGAIYKDSIYTKTTERYDKKGNIIENIFYNSTDNTSFKTEYSYNKTERQKITYRENGEVFYKTITKLNAGNKVTEENTYYGTDPNTVSNRKIFKYNDQGLETSEMAYNGINMVNNITFKYVGNKKKFEAEDNLYSPQIKTFKYFTNGVITSKYNYDVSINEGLITKTLYKYDEHNQLTAELLYDADGKLLFTNTYKYDQKGNKVEEVKYSSDYAPSGTRSNFEYSDYDKRGNWHTAKWMDGNTRRSYIVERKIAYY